MGPESQAQCIIDAGSSSRCDEGWITPTVNFQCTLRASLSGTFLQTLPELVTPLKGHSLSPHGCPPTLSAPSERSWVLIHCVSNTVSKHARKHETRLSRVKQQTNKQTKYKTNNHINNKKFRLDSNDFGFICAGVSNVGGHKSNT